MCVCVCVCVCVCHARIQEFSSGGGGPGNSDNVFYVAISVFYRSQMVNFKKNYHFSRFRMGSIIFQGGGVQLLPGGPLAYFLWKTI